MGFLGFLKKQRAQPIGEDWDWYRYATSDGVASVSYDAQRARETHHADLPHGRSVVFPANEQMERQQDALLSALSAAGVDCLLVAWQVDATTLELLFQTSAPPAFDAVFAAWRAKRRPDAVLREHDGWSRFDDAMKPDEFDRVWRIDIDVIEALEKAGSDFGKDHDIEHCFLGTPAQLAQVKDALVPRGFRVGEREDGALVLIRALRIVNQDITDTTVPLRRLAREVGATYDGWAAVVVR